MTAARFSSALRQYVREKIEHLRDKNQQEAEQHFEKQAWVFESMKEESLNQP